MKQRATTFEIGKVEERCLNGDQKWKTQFDSAPKIISYLGAPIIFSLTLNP